ncbi:MAG TPA: GtrA family protein [Chitinophagaceae bacterium]|nr:GtrA family protein [Chitinophagaceae bacterium]
MRRHIHNARDVVLPVIDLFYPPFRKLMNLQTFRYLFSGGLNTLVGLTAYFITYKYVLKGENLHLGFYAFKSHNAALFISSCISFPFGFFLMKYVVFTDSNMRGRIQIFRYLMVYLFNLALNYLLLKVFVERLHVYPVLAQIITTVIIICFSYVAQRNFTFRIRNEEEEEPID